MKGRINWNKHASIRNQPFDVYFGKKITKFQPAICIFFFKCIVICRMSCIWNIMLIPTLVVFPKCCHYNAKKVILLIVFRITPRKFDTVQASEQFKGGIITSDIGDLTLSKRGIRTSFTFRKVRCVPCNCSKSLISSILHQMLFWFVYISMLFSIFISWNQQKIHLLYKC